MGLLYLLFFPYLCTRTCVRQTFWVSDVGSLPPESERSVLSPWARYDEILFEKKRLGALCVSAGGATHHYLLRPIRPLLLATAVLHSSSPCFFGDRWRVGFAADTADDLAVARGRQLAWLPSVACPIHLSIRCAVYLGLYLVPDASRSSLRPVG